MRPQRELATPSGLRVICFLLLTFYELHFFLLHLYQSILYIALLIMLFYMED